MMLKSLMNISLLIGGTNASLRGSLKEQSPLQRRLQTTPTPTTAGPTTAGPTPSPVTVIAIPETYQVQENTIMVVDANDGLLENDSVSRGGLEVTTVTAVGDLRGDLEWETDGAFAYEPDSNYLGTVAFDYTACSTIVTTDCDTARVTMTIFVDPLRPNKVPEAKNDKYEVQEGETLRVSGSGFLNNDVSGAPFDPLYRCEESSDTSNSLSTDSDGGFRYVARRCFTGTESFRYRACYQNYNEMESNEAVVEIEVKESDDRPETPDLQDKSFEVYEAVELDRDSDDGLLTGLDRQSELYIKNYEKQGDWPGRLRVDEDGAVRYQAISGEKGDFQFTYEVCWSDWEDCVDCSTGTATISVTTNPDKPANPPSPRSGALASITVEGGERYRGSVVDHVDYDGNFNLRAEDFSTPDDFKGTLNTDSDGSFEYGNAPIGAESFTYRVCYREWPDLCADGEIYMATEDTSTGGSSSRQGVGSLYEVFWKGESTNCNGISPSLTAYCNNDGVMSLVESGPDNSLCTFNSIGHLNCQAATSGTIHVECRDPTSSNALSRQIIASLGSSEVPCGGPTPRQTQHSVEIRTWCSNEFQVNNLSYCYPTPLFAAVSRNGGATSTQVCYSNDQALLGNSKPEDVVAASSVDNSCIVTNGSPIPGVATPVLAKVGNDDSPEEAFPLQQCQGDCDDDNDCAGSMVCFQRSGSQVVPGCLGTGVDLDNIDICIPGSSSSSNSSARQEPKLMEHKGNDGDPKTVFPLEECQSDCDSDNDCTGDLVCFQRNGSESVRGCYGDNNDLRGEDFCVRPEN